MQNFKLRKPVLFIVFNRLDTTKKVFEEIRKSKPPKLYLASDGARKECVGENETVNNIRKYLLKNIDWECDVKTLFRKSNLGCKENVSKAITWLFENEEDGIILEDDCLPHKDFFRFTQEMLDLYKVDTRIMYISGTCLPLGKLNLKESYHFTQYGCIWGWATWRRAWGKYDIKMNSYDAIKKKKYIKQIMPNLLTRLRYLWTLKSVKNGKINTWDIQWGLAIRANNGLIISPNNNMISNIGFNAEGVTHTQGSSKWESMLLKPLPSKIIHPEYIIPSVNLYNKYCMQKEIDVICNYLARLLFKKFKRK
jgi:hypothetical protein